jgi:hypothetical protein
MAQVNQEYIDAIKQAQSDMQSIQQELGAYMLMELRKDKLLKAYSDAEAVISSVRTKILEEHGDGNLDLSTGEFTPSTGAEVFE